jgi:hypothetical protein
MDLYNIEVETNGILLPLSDVHCRDLKPYQLLKYQDNCVFSEIAKKTLLNSGMNVNETHILIEYNNRNIYEVKSKLIDKDNNNLDCCIKQIITLNDIGIKGYYDKNSNNLLVNKSKIGGCVLINSNIINSIRMISDITCGISILEISYYHKCPDIDIIYNNNDIIKKKIHTEMLLESDFINIDKPLDIVNNYINIKNINDFIKNNSYDKVDKNMIISIKNTEKAVEGRILDEKKYSHFSDSINVLDIEECLLSYKNLLLEFKSDDMFQYYQDMCRSINRSTKDNINSLFNKELLPELFLENELETEEERFIKEICIKILEKSNKMYTSNKFDITIGYDTHISKMNDKEMFTIMLCFECCEEDDNQIVIISDNNNDYSPTHVYVIKPKVLNIISIGSNLRYKNMMNKEKYIQINIYEKISTDDYIKTTSGRLLKKPMIKIVDGVLNREFEKGGIINYIENASETYNIQTSNCENLKVDFIEKIYRNYLSGDKVLHFSCNHNITLINNYNENINAFSVNNTTIHKRFNELLKTFINNNENDKHIINGSDILFNPAICVFKNIVIEAINEIYKNNSYLLNIKEIFILNKNKSEYNRTGYNDLIDNKNRNFIIYTRINIDIEDDLFGEITLYTNYVNYEEYGKKTLNFIIETIDTKEDIISIEEQEQLIEFANRNIEKIERISICDYIDESKIEKITPFIYGEKNMSWDLYSDRWGNIDENIKNILNNTRERIIKKEKFNFKDEEPSDLPSFFQILKSGSATHYHTDRNDNDMYHIRFNVIIQNAECGGESIYNGIVKRCMERQYIMCRSGIDKHSSRSIIGDKPRLAISYGFNIPKVEIMNYPNIFGDLIKDKSI